MSVWAPKQSNKRTVPACGYVGWCCIYHLLVAMLGHVRSACHSCRIDGDKADKINLHQKKRNTSFVTKLSKMWFWAPFLLEKLAFVLQLGQANVVLLLCAGHVCELWNGGAPKRGMCASLR